MFDKRKLLDQSSQLPEETAAVNDAAAAYYDYEPSFKREKMAGAAKTRRRCAMPFCGPRSREDNATWLVEQESNLVIQLPAKEDTSR